MAQVNNFGFATEPTYFSFNSINTPLFDIEDPLAGVDEEIAAKLKAKKLVHIPLDGSRASGDTYTKLPRSAEQQLIDFGIALEGEMIAQCLGLQILKPEAQVPFTFGTNFDNFQRSASFEDSAFKLSDDLPENPFGGGISSKEEPVLPAPLKLQRSSSNGSEADIEDNCEPSPKVSYLDDILTDEMLASLAADINEDHRG